MADTLKKRKINTSDIITIVSLSLVLFMLGLLGVLVLNSHKLSKNIKENIGIQLLLRENAKEETILNLESKIKKSPYCREIEFVSKDSAAASFQRHLGEDFISFLGFNPLLASVSIKLNTDFATTESMDAIAKELQNEKVVKEVIYQKSLVSEINENVNKIGLIILFFSSILFFISLALIHNTIRLTIYSKRFIIKTMQLVGATKSFIRLPFIIKGIRQGIVAAFIAMIVLSGILYFAQKQLPELRELQDFKMLFSLFGIVILLGIIISWISTSIAVRKYLRLKTGDLNY